MMNDSDIETTANDRDDYRTLLDLTQRGLLSGKALVYAVHNSQAAQNDEALRTLSVKAECHLADAQADIDELWSKFRLVYEP